MQIIKLFKFTHVIWKRRCDMVANSTDETYEGHIRNKCRTLFFSLQTDPSKLPTFLHYLLNKSQSFFNKARPRALQSWLSRLQTGMDKVQHQPYSHTDIRNWVCHTHHTLEKRSPPTKMTSDNDSR